MKSISVRMNLAWLSAAARKMILAVAVSSACTGSAWAYVGTSYMQIPGIEGGWTAQPFRNWIKVDGNYWTTSGMRMRGFGRSPFYFSGPGGPASGKGKLMIGINKDNPILPQLMDKCLKQSPITEMTFAEPAVLARGPTEMGPRPAGIPDYYQYKFMDVRLSDCAVVTGAPQQAFVVNFSNIERLTPVPDRVPIKLTPASFVPAANTGKSKTFVLTWFGAAHDVSDDQCPVLNAKPTEDQYYELMAKEDADKERVANAPRGGVNFQNGQMGRRGPSKIDVTMLPGIVRDPGHAEPQTRIARGLDLDGNDGTGKPPAGIRQHKNYVAPDGRTGIDNQLYTVKGCVPSWQGHKGFQIQFANNSMRDGLMSMLLQITGIDNERNDSSVDVTLFYSLDPMAKNAAGTQILTDYTFRVTDKPDYAHYFLRLKGRIVNGVVVTERAKTVALNLERYNFPMDLLMFDAGMRLELTPDGNIKGVLGGYMDWRVIINRYVSSTVEQYMGVQIPALYNSLKRNADGLKDPLTGEYNGISAAYDIEGIPVFIAPVDPHQKIAQAAVAPQPAAPARAAN